MISTIFSNWAIRSDSFESFPSVRAALVAGSFVVGVARLLRRSIGFELFVRSELVLNWLIINTAFSAVLFDWIELEFGIE